jgi:hypothetical protein
MFEAAVLQYFRLTAAPAAGHWTEQLVLENLRDLHRGGHDLRYRHRERKRDNFHFGRSKIESYPLFSFRIGGIELLRHL